MEAITACLWLSLLLQVQFVTASNETSSHKYGLFGIVVEQAVELRKQAGQLEKQESQLQKQGSQLQQQASQLQQLQKQVSQMQQQKNQMQQQASQLQKLQNQISGLQQQRNKDAANLASLKDMRSKQVVFSATYKDFWTDLNVGTRGTLKFNYIINNLGNGYNRHTGHFTAPYPGHYAFYARISLSENYSYVTLAIYKGHSTQLAVVTVRDLSVWDKDTVFVTTHLNKGEVVLVRIRDGGTVINAGQYTTFSGMLVAAD